MKKLESFKGSKVALDSVYGSGTFDANTMTCSPSGCNDDGSDEHWDCPV